MQDKYIHFENKMVAALGAMVDGGIMKIKRVTKGEPYGEVVEVTLEEFFNLLVCKEMDIRENAIVSSEDMGALLGITFKTYLEGLGDLTDVDLEVIAKDVALSLAATYKKKNMDYGDSFTKSLDKFGVLAALVRLEDKYNRLQNLKRNPERVQVMDESILDTLLDAMNYCMMTQIWLEEQEQEDARES